jgi:hypothetical protein
MAWTTPRTWTTGEIVTAALLNAQIKANMDLTAPAIMTTLGDIIYCSAANTPSRLAKSTTSTQYLANTGTSNVPQWNEVALATGVSGSLPVANGGTAATSAGIAAFNSITGYSAAGATGTTSTNLVFSTSPTFITPALGTPSAGVLTSCTGLPEAGLAVSNAPTNGYMLTAQSGDAGGMTWAAAGSGLDAASQAEMEAASSNTVAATPGRTQNHPGVAKGWVRIAAAGTIVSGDYNVASITDTGTGHRTIVWDTDFADTNYAVLGHSFLDSGAGPIIDFDHANIAAGSIPFRIRTSDATYTPADVASSNMAFGDQ